MSFLRKTRLLLPVLISALLLTGCFAKPGQNPNKNTTAFEQTFFVMDTFVSVQIYAESEAKAEALFQDVQEEMVRLESILSSHIASSEVVEIGNFAGAKPVQVSADTMAVISTALEYAVQTQGAFDITLAPVLRLYNFTKGEEAKPSNIQLTETLPLVEWRKVIVNQAEGTVFLAEEGMTIDLGGIAKGYITDRAADILVAQGIKTGLVNSGGDIKLLGPKADGTPWRVGIKNPHQPATNFAIIEVSGGAIVTSGDYERYFVENGIRYHHIINPETGLPAEMVRSVTILAPDAETADLLSTAVFVLGPEAGMVLVEELTGVEAVIWDKDDRVTWSSGLYQNPDGSNTVDYYFTINNSN